MIESISKILGSCDSENTVLPPTELFNEGWLLRLALDWFDRNRFGQHPLSFAPEARWYSNALLPSRFLPRKRNDTNAESFTHADGIIGHFGFYEKDHGYIKLQPDSKQFVVIEAKLGSPLSKGTKNSPTFNQAARTVACIAHMIYKAEINPASIDRLAFFVIAPNVQIRKGIFKDFVSKDCIEKKVRNRIDLFQDAHDIWFDKFLLTLDHMEIGLMAWENVLMEMPRTDEVDILNEFYAKCLHYNLSRVANPM